MYMAESTSVKTEVYPYPAPKVTGVAVDAIEGDPVNGGVPSLKELKKIAPAGYEILERLGQGGMGVVFLARQKRLKRNVALKMLLPEVASDWEFMKRLEKEAVTLARLNHPNIVGCHDILHDRGKTFLVMEFVEGRLSLSDLMKYHGKLEEKYALRIILDAVRGLAYANRKNVIHRDIKPDNLLIYQEDPGPEDATAEQKYDLHRLFDRRNGRVMLVDFGLAQENQRQDINSDSESESNPNPISAVIPDASPDSEIKEAYPDEDTWQDKIIGSPAYMAPEQAKVQAVDFRADIFALGITLKQMLTGKNPFEAATPQEALSRKINPDPQWLNESEAADEINMFSCDVEAILQKMTAWRPEDRYDSYDRLIQDLEKALKGLGNPLVRGKFCMKTWLRETPYYPARMMTFAAVLTALIGGMIFWAAGAGSFSKKSPPFLDESLNYWEGESVNAWSVASLEEDTDGDFALIAHADAGWIRTVDSLSTNEALEMEMRLPAPGRISMRLENEGEFPGSIAELFRAEWVRSSLGTTLRMWSQGQELKLPVSGQDHWNPWDWMKLRIHIREGRLVVFIDDELTAQAESNLESGSFWLALEAPEGKMAQFNKIRTLAL